MKYLKDKLTRAKEELDAFEQQHFGGGRLDHGEINRPLSSRGDIDAQLEKHTRLVNAVTVAENRLHAARLREKAPQAAAEKERAHKEANLRGEYGYASEVFWTISQTWLPVVRWNRKTVAVRLAGGTEHIPHTQVGGAR